MPLFLISEGDAILVALLAGLLYLIAIIFLLAGIISSFKKPKYSKPLLIIAFVLFTIGTGICGFSRL